jgi:hypothetical protein
MQNGDPENHLSIYLIAPECLPEMKRNEKSARFFADESGEGGGRGENSDTTLIAFWCSLITGILYNAIYFCFGLGSV